MKFLEKYEFNKEDIADFLNNSPKKLIDEIKKSKKLVCENIEYLKELGVTNYQKIFLEYYDMFLIEKLNKNIRIIEYL